MTLKTGLVIEEIKKLDPEEKCVKVDSSEQKIHYFLKKKCTFKFMKEEIVRAYYVVFLVREMGFRPSCIDVEKEWDFQIGRTSKKPRTDIVIYKNDSPFILFEIKPPHEFESQKHSSIKGQLFGVANNLTDKEELLWLCYATIFAEKEILKEMSVIDYTISSSYKKWKINGEPLFSQLPIKGKTKVLKKGETILKPITEEAVMKLKRNLHNKLWRGGTRGDNKIFFNLLKIIISKIYDENETANNQAYSFQIQYDGEAIDYGKTYDNIQKLFSNTLLDKNYLDIKKEKLDKLKEIEGGIDKIEFTREEIAFTVNEFQNYSLKVTDYDVLSIFFESIIREEFKESTGLYFTPTNIVKTVLYGLEVDELSKKLLKEERRLPFVIDSSVGSGTFLTEYMKIITDTIISNSGELSVTDAIKDMIKEKFDSDKKRHPWAREFIYGIDLYPHLALTTKVNMIMHGDGHIHIFAEDGLEDFDNFEGVLRKKHKNDLYGGETNECFDIVISNPPFSAKIEEKTREKYKEIFPELGKKGSEIIFIERWFQLLKERGRLGVVLPESIFNTTNNIDVRLFIYKYFWVKAVISLPDGMKNGAFAPYTGTKTSLLFAQKKTNDEIKTWSDMWYKFENEFRKLKNEIEKYFGVFDGKKGKTIMSFVDSGKGEKNNIIRLLKGYIEDNFKDEDADLEIGDLIKKYYGEVETMEKKWWVFKQVVKEIEKIYPESKTKIYMAHTDKIGYKRTKRNRFVTDNMLFSTKTDDGKEKVSIDLSEPKTILDEMRDEVKWD